MATPTTHRITIVIAPELKQRVTRAAHHSYCSASEWIRRNMERALVENETKAAKPGFSKQESAAA